MRTDENLAPGICDSESWKNQPSSQGRLFEYYEKSTDGKVRAHSQSGHERNHLFLNDQKGKFIDQSIISGTDSICDSRTNVAWDFDGDGWQDLAIVNANYPHLQIFHNQMSKVDELNPNQVIAVRLVGGSTSFEPDGQWSNRDACGAKIKVTPVGGPMILRELNLGEGFAAQNSATKLIGIGTSDLVDIQIEWPSGKSNSRRAVRSKSLVTVYEDSRQADGEHFVVSDYGENPSPIPELIDNEVRFELTSPPENKKPFRLYVSMATWCAACKKSYPQIQLIRDVLGNEVEVYGLPTDVEDTPEKLETYMEKNSPGYLLIKELAETDRAKFHGVMVGVSETEVLPSSVLTDSRGVVLYRDNGVPTISEIRRAISVGDDRSRK